MASKVLGYVRVSLEEMAQFGHSLAAQRDKITKYAELYELDLVAIVEDDGQSASSLDRPGIQDCLTRLRSGAVCGLVVAKLDRLTREVPDWFHLLDNFFGDRAKHRYVLHSVSEHIDCRTANGRFLLALQILISQHERETIAERTSTALQYMAANNLRVSHGPGLGKKFVAIPGATTKDGAQRYRTEWDDEQLNIISEIVVRHKKGVPYETIASNCIHRNLRDENGDLWGAANPRKGTIQGDPTQPRTKNLRRAVAWWLEQNKAGTLPTFRAVPPSGNP